jgi:hypothetical protein
MPADAASVTSAAEAVRVTHTTRCCAKMVGRDQQRSRLNELMPPYFGPHAVASTTMQRSQVADAMLSDSGAIGDFQPLALHSWAHDLLNYHGACFEAAEEPLGAPDLFYCVFSILQDFRSDVLGERQCQEIRAGSPRTSA